MSEETWGKKLKIKRKRRGKKGKPLRFALPHFVSVVKLNTFLNIAYLSALLSKGNVMVGPLNVKEGKPLPPDLEEFVNDSGGHGFIIVSFGSNLASILPRTVVDTLATAFGKLKQRVVWRLKGINDIFYIYFPLDVYFKIIILPK